MSSSALDPSEPAQPKLDDAYKTRGNPASKEPAEQAEAQRNANDNSGITDQRIPREQSSSVADATPTSLGYGVRGAPPGEEAKGYTEEDVGRHQELDAAQMGAPGEGKVAEAVEEKAGASGKEQGMEMDLDRKKAEQKEAREAVGGQREKAFDVGGVLGQQSAPADPTI
jgi:hypothetical protein